jgi:hypothetical protein
LVEPTSARPEGLIGPAEIGAGDALWFAWGRLFILVPRQVRPTADVEAAFEGHQATIGQPLMFVVVVQETTERPGDELQEAHRGHLTRLEPKLAGHTFVVRSAGFIGSFFISILSRVLMATRRRAVPQALHTDFEPAATWIARHLRPAKVTPESIVRVLRWVDTFARRHEP